MATGHDIYYYKMTDDSGLAPCVDNRLLTLAVCMTKTRSVAVPGDTVVGFGSNEDGARLIYIARVTEKLADGDYYRLPKYRQRRDCIYEDCDGVARLRRGVRVHATAEHFRKDVGRHFENGHVLLSVCKDFRYLGVDGTAEYQARFQTLAAKVLATGQNHRVRHTPTVQRELRQLIDDTFSKYTDCVVGQPSDPWPDDGGCGCAPKPKRPRSC